MHLITEKILHVFYTKTFLKSIVVGGISTIFDLIFLFVFKHYLGWHYMISVNIAFVMAIIVNFLLQKYWAFESAGTLSTYIQFIRFSGLSGFNLLVNAGFMYVLVSYLGVWYLSGQIIAVAILAIFNFLVYNFFIFNDCAL